MSPSRPTIGRRKRRLRRTLAWVLLFVGVSLAIGAAIYFSRRPEVRRPGELTDITERLSRDLPAGAPAPRFVDATAEAGLAEFRAFAGERTSRLPEDMGSGVAWGDFDADGDEDLLLVGAGAALGLPEAERAETVLYENLGDGTFRRSPALGETRIQGMAAAWGDANGDGRLDLVLTGFGTLRLLLNDGGRLVASDALPDRDGFWAGASWGDFDGDRDLDLYVCGYVRYVEEPGSVRKATEQYGQVVPYTLNPASFEPEPNLLFENLGGGRFREVAELYGVSNPGGRSLSALWHDFDGDGRLDLYVANDISDNALYLNRGDTFEDASLAAWVADYRGAMGLAAGDWNRDGDDDLFVTHWVAQENALYDSRLVDSRAAAAAAGRAIPLSFSDLSSPVGLGQISLQRVGWGTEFADFDGDGWLDLVVANGSTMETADEPKRLKPQPPMLLWNQAGEYFHDLAPADPLLAAARVARGLALADYDRDGDLDVALVRLDGGAELLRNEMQAGSWVELRLVSRGAGGEPTGSGEGSTVVLEAGGVELRRTVGSASYLSQSSRTLHFGLGGAERIDSLTVRWLGGDEQAFTGIEPRALWELTEGEPDPRRVARPAAPAAAAPPAGEPAAPLDERQRLLAFWAAQRAGMDAFKIDSDCETAVERFREALAIDPTHGDSLYYLANCLAAMGETDAALDALDRLRTDDPMSHRGHKQWGILRALTAGSRGEMDEAAVALERALEINQEETGSLLALGEIALLRGEPELARQRLEWACRTNPKAVGGFFLRGYLAWRDGDGEQAAVLLRTAHEARGPEWKPEGTVAEGDVARRMHREATPLSPFWEAWDGTPDPGAAFAALDRRLAEAPF